MRIEIDVGLESVEIDEFGVDVGQGSSETDDLGLEVAAT